MAFFPQQPPAVSTGIETSDGVAVGKERYTGTPKVSSNNSGTGQPVGIIKEGRIPVILFAGGFHTP